MSEKLTKAMLIKALKEIGVEESMTLEVHSSLSSFGYVEGGAETVISALKECVGASGSIFMPALRLSQQMELTEEDQKLGITTKIKILEENCDRSAMGIIADTFRKQPDTKTGTGIFRISGWGKHADEAVKSGLEYVIKNGGKALLLGVDIYRLTAMHYVEGEAMPKEIRERSEPGEKINAIYSPDEWFIEVGEMPVKAWYTIQKMAYEKGYIKDGMIGSCKVMFLDVYEVIELYRQELLNHPFKLYGLE